jgi:hypothetical protein
LLFTPTPVPQHATAPELRTAQVRDPYPSIPSTAGAAQTPLLQTCPPEQTVPEPEQPPQWLESEARLRQKPEQLVRPTPQPQTPLLHAWPTAHVLPQPPQFCVSVCLSWHVPEQFVSLAAQ